MPTLYVSEEQILFGSLLFCKVNECGKTIGLEDEDFERIEKYIQKQVAPMEDFLRREQRRMADRRKQ